MCKINNALLENLIFKSEDFVRKSAVLGSLVSHLAKEGIVYIDSGAVEVSSVALDGAPVTVKTLNKGDIFGIIELFGNTDTDTVLICSKDTQFVIVKKEAVLRHMQSDSAFSFKVVKLLNEKIKFLFKRLSCFTTKSATHKVASLVLSDNKSLSRDAQAALLGISRATLFRELNALKDLGYIDTKGSKIIVLQRELLERL